jgi:cytochrome bd-type quinol oxidase subunit 2
MMDSNLYAAFQLVNIALLLLWVILSFLALFQLRGRNLSSGLKLGWTLIILLLPVIGALAFLIVVPKEPKLE